MAVVSKSALVPYTAAEMYALVDDVTHYPDFLPWCRSAKEWDRTEDEVYASIELAKGAIRKAFTTHNRLQKDKMIEMRLVEGPFHCLEGFWRFQPLGEDACKVSLDLEYEFSNSLLKMTLGPVFGQITNTLVDAFCQRAREIHGKR
ncbi:MAG TPA: type II toxin-antitoxin system RatA family toxin [Gammaproteobacteria bacterium]|nr:type II toxin-antitoxin system RatA family toxin [Gammaproteobacteria bacterium]